MLRRASGHIVGSSRTAWRLCYVMYSYSFRYNVITELRYDDISNLQASGQNLDYVLEFDIETLLVGNACHVHEA